MTTPTELPDTAAAVLDVLRDSTLVIRSEQADQLLAVAHWADLHPGVGDTSILGADEQPGGDGTPAVAAFTAEPLAHALAETPRAAQALLADTLDLRHRLPRTWEQVHALMVPVAKARQIAQKTRELSFEGAQWVDRQLLGRAGALGVAALDRLVRTAVAQFAPETLRSAEDEAHRSWDVQVVHPRNWVGTSSLVATGDTRAVMELFRLVQDAAEALPETDDTAGQRRFHALACLGTSNGAGRPANLRMYVHLDLADLLDETNTIGTVDGLGPLTMRTIKDWCGGSQVTVVPVLDLADEPWSPRHDPPPRMAEQVIVRDQRCVFPRCQTPARLCDLDHVVAWQKAGKPPPRSGRLTVMGRTTRTGKATGTVPVNLAPLCRRHHRLKTLGRWRYERLPDGGFWWEGPHGQTALVTAGGIASLP